MTILLVLAAALALLAMSLQRTYRRVTERELRQRAREGDELAMALFKAVAYGHSLNTVLWFLVGVTNGLLFVLIAQLLPMWLALLLIAVFIWLGFVWLPARDVTRMGTWLAVRLAPAFAWVLSYLHPLLDGINNFVGKHRPVTIHTGLYDKYDLLELLSYQRVQPDNRVQKVELELAQHALTFGDKLVRDVMIPRRVVKTVSADETIGPILMAELHDSGFSRLPVYSGKKDNIVGTLYMHDLVGAKSGGQIAKVMRPEVYFVHEEQPLTDALQAILKTKRHLYIVVNSFEEFVGIITIEDVLEQIVGKPIIDEFDQYDDLRAVAARAARKEHKQHTEAEKAETQLEEAPESAPEPKDTSKSANS